MVADAQTAEDIVENTMFKLWRDRDKFKNVLNIKSYLYAMVRNDAYRIANKEKGKILLNEELTEDHHDDFDEKILEEEVYAILIEQLNQLPEGCKEIFELSVIEGLKYKEIASILNISVNTVKSQRARAIKLLKEKLKNHPFLLLLIAID
ncbi:sigma-70 family RNA polymerase sigma factor [Zunongwangia sp. M21534]|uniref:Sigma-70 family RNA polymerase sigma factor n=1 Tax=Zunongwangia pacifica TaxID=2911062 RepID=A0A9X1ZQ85_9FLAO|nr:sigma-70 family RNA polymerase sigma factor [Zunongwangia pacifica]